MNSVAKLNQRMEDLAQVVKDSPEGLALMGLGSVGVETSRLDQWSDLDFFVILRPGFKKKWIDDPSWLEKPNKVSYLFRNTTDGYKLLWADGIFAEMAVFESHELANIPYAEGRLVWAHQDFDPSLRIAANPGFPRWKPDSIDWSLGEMLTCLYVGLCRYRRGEKLSAWRFIQSFCLDRFLEVIDATQTPREGLADLYSKDRRFESLYPDAVKWLPRFETGYDGTPEAALAFVEWAETIKPVNPGLKAEIEKLARG